MCYTSSVCFNYFFVKFNWKLLCPIKIQCILNSSSFIFVGQFDVLCQVLCYFDNFDYTLSLLERTQCPTVWNTMWNTVWTHCENSVKSLHSVKLERFNTVNHQFTMWNKSPLCEHSVKNYTTVWNHLYTVKFERFNTVTVWAHCENTVGHCVLSSRGNCPDTDNA